MSVQSQEKSENLSYVVFIPIGDFLYIDEIMNSVSLPKLILNQTNINYLNLPTFSTTKTIKYYFNKQFITVVLLNDLFSNIYTKKVINLITEYSKDMILIIISENQLEDPSYILKHFYLNKYTNVVYF